MRLVEFFFVIVGVELVVWVVVVLEEFVVGFLRVIKVEIVVVVFDNIVLVVMVCCFVVFGIIIDSILF